MTILDTRMQAIADTFGDSGISIHLGRDKVFPNKPLLEKTVERIEAALQDPSQEKAALRVMQGQDLLYRSARGVVTHDLKAVAAQFQTNTAVALETQAAPITPPDFERSLIQRPNAKPIQTPQEAIQAAIEPQLRTQAQSRHPKTSSAIVLAPSKALIPLEPTPQQLDKVMPAVVQDPDAPQQAQPPASNADLEKALEAAHDRIDALAQQLEATQKALDDLSNHVKSSSIQAWASQSSYRLRTTLQSIVLQAKSKVVHWMTQAKAHLQSHSAQLKAATQQTVAQVKTTAHESLQSATSTAHLKSIETREALRQGINQFLSPVDLKALSDTAVRVIDEWGKEGVFKGNTFEFRRSEGGDISIHTQDGRTVFVNGALTTHDPATIAHLAELPRRLEVAQRFHPSAIPTHSTQMAR